LAWVQIMTLAAALIVAAGGIVGAVVAVTLH
jgi:hypothetical protein